MKITMQDILAHAPDLAEQLRAEGASAALTKGIAQGATAERERIQSVEAQAMPGHEALINGFKFDGKTTGPEAAVAVLSAERTTRGKALSDRQAEAPKPAAHAAAESDTASAQAAAEAGLSVEDKAKADWDKDAELRAEFGGDLKRYMAYAVAHASGKIKVLKK